MCGADVVYKHAQGHSANAPPLKVSINQEPYNFRVPAGGILQLLGNIACPVQGREIQCVSHDHLIDQDGDLKVIDRCSEFERLLDRCDEGPLVFKDL